MNHTYYGGVKKCIFHYLLIKDAYSWYQELNCYVTINNKHYVMKQYVSLKGQPESVNGHPLKEQGKHIEAS